MQRFQKYFFFDTWIILIFCVSITAQIGLAFVNKESNDDHVEVVERIMNHSPVERESCWQCYHPKLYHYTVAGISESIGASSFDDVTRVGQFVDVLAGGLILIIVWLFLCQQKAALISKRLAFTFFAFNPELISGAIQATNNVFAVLFSTIALYCLWKFFKNHEKRYFGIMSASVILTALTKGSGLVLCGGVIICLIIHLLSIRKNRITLVRHSLLTTIFAFAFLLSMVAASPYYSYWMKYGSPLVGNWQTYPFPHLTEKTYYDRPGITSLTDGFLTFRFIGLMQTPYLTNGPADYSLHRTSFWSNLYGHMYSIHFPQWPQSWHSESPEVVFITRVLFILGLFPTVILLIGFGLSLYKIWRGLRQERLSYFLKNPEWVFALFLPLMILMVARLSTITRDFSAIKMIYVYPALLCLVYFFIEGYECVVQKTLHHRLLVSRLSKVWMGLTIIFVLYDLWVLFMNLARIVNG